MSDRRPLGRAAFALAALGVVDLPIAPLALLAWLAGPWVAATVGALVAIALAITLANVAGRGAFGVLVAGVIASLAAGAFGGDVARALFAPAEVVTSVADAASHPGASSYELEGGSVRTDLGASIEESFEAGDPASTFSVYPLVPVGWSPDAPVPIWVAVGPTSGPLVADARRGVAVDLASESSYRRAIAAAEQAHGIHGEVGAPLVHLVGATSPAGSGAPWLLALALVATNLAVLVVALRSPARA